MNRVSKHFRLLMTGGRVLYEVWCWLDFVLVLLFCNWLVRQPIPDEPGQTGLHLAAGLWAGYIAASIPRLIKAYDRYIG